MKDKSGGKIKKEFIALRAKKYVIKKLMFYKNCLETTQLENRINQLEKYKVNMIVTVTGFEPTTT